jgi:hypothetical protein
MIVEPLREKNIGIGIINHMNQFLFLILYFFDLCIFSCKQKHHHHSTNTTRKFVFLRASFSNLFCFPHQFETEKFKELTTKEPDLSPQPTKKKQKITNHSFANA